MEYKAIEETVAMEDLFSDRIPPIDDRLPYIAVGYKVDTLVSLNLTVELSVSNHVKRTRIVLMMGKYMNKHHNKIFKQAMPFIRDRTKVPNKLLMGQFSVPGAFEWLMSRYKILECLRYQIGQTVDILDDNYLAALAVGEEEEAETPILEEEPDVSNPFEDEAPRSPNSDTVTGMGVKRDDGSGSEMSKEDKDELEPDISAEEGKTSGSEQECWNSIRWLHLICPFVMCGSGSPCSPCNRCYRRIPATGISPV